MHMPFGAGQDWGVSETFNRLLGAFQLGGCSGGQDDEEAKTDILQGEISFHKHGGG
jgi:hypothetical protein